MMIVTFAVLVDGLSPPVPADTSSDGGFTVVAPCCVAPPATDGFNPSAMLDAALPDVPLVV